MTEKPKSSPSAPDLTHRFSYDENIKTLFICVADPSSEERIDFIGIDSLYHSKGPSVTGKCGREFFQNAPHLTDSEIVLLQLKSYKALLSSLCIAPYGKEIVNRKS